jgi:hypothetical protein
VIYGIKGQNLKWTCLGHAADSNTEQRSVFLFGFSVCYDLIPTFPVCYLEVLQAEALQSKQEKQESNRKKRAAQQQAVQLKKQVVKLQVKALQPSLVEAEESEEDAQIHTWAIRSKQRNRGVTAHFEQHVRCALATGATARQVTDMLRLDASYLLEPDQASIFIHDLPQLRWVQTQREGLGIESYLYSFMRIAGASRVLQWGFDETTLDGVSVLNQWALLEFPMDAGSGGGEQHNPNPYPNPNPKIYCCLLSVLFFLLDGSRMRWK